jgi:ABC-type xylose transport system permease subunit
MFDRVVAQMSPAAWMAIGLLAVIAGKQIEFTVLMLVGAAAATLGVVQLLKAARQPE